MVPVFDQFTADGSDQSYTLSQMPDPTKPFLVWQNGVGPLKMGAGNGFTLAVNVVTLSVLPGNGQPVDVLYYAAAATPGISQCAPQFDQFTADGVDRTFAFSKAPDPTKPILFFWDGILLRQGAGDDYTLTDGVATLVELPDAGEGLAVLYWPAAYSPYIPAGGASLVTPSLTRQDEVEAALIGIAALALIGAGITDIAALTREDMDEDDNFVVQPPALRTVFERETFEDEGDHSLLNYKSDQRWIVLVGASRPSTVQIERAAAQGVLEAAKSAFAGANFILSSSVRPVNIALRGDELFQMTAEGTWYALRLSVLSWPQFTQNFGAGQI